MITRILVGEDNKYYFQRDNKDVSTHKGLVTAQAVNEAPDGAALTSNTGHTFIVITPTFLDRYKRLERGPQLMTLKDLGVIAAETGMGQESVVGDAGTGTGAAAIYFARIAKQVHSYDIVQAHHDLGVRNAAALGMKNITFSIHDVYESIPNESFDVFVLDNPEPWNALKSYTSLKIGGWFVAYLPSINQTANFANAVQEHGCFEYKKTIELIEREWAIKGLRVRPSSDAIGHTAFLVFARRIR